MSNVPWTGIYPDSAAAQEAAGGGGGAFSSGNPLYPGMPEGATPIHRDKVITTATTTDLWTPGAGRRFILASAFISSDTAMRVAVIDDADLENQRPVDQYVAANGGSSPNLVPVPYVSKNAGSPLRVVTSAAGNVRIRVSGWEVDA